MKQYYVKCFIEKLKLSSFYCEMIMAEPQYFSPFCTNQRSPANCPPKQTFTLLPPAVTCTVQVQYSGNLEHVNYLQGQME